MTKIVSLSFVCISLLNAAEVLELPSIEVTEKKIDVKVLRNISEEEIKSADLSEVLTKHIPSVSIVRRSGIANDIIFRGAKKDNINILIDNSKIYGACPNRMDPATSHVLTNNIEEIEVIEGPYDVENFGTLSGLVKVKTKEPSEELSGDINLNMGSFGYKKASFSVSGGNDKIKLLLSSSKEESEQYKDGNGNDFYGQQVANGTVSTTTNEYSIENRDKKAYEKKTLLTKAIINLDDSSELNISYTANRSESVLYPNTPMDADSDDSDIYTIEYTKRNLSKYSKELNAEYYYSKVDHPMSTTLRDNGSMEMTNYMKSSIWGAKIKNSMNFQNGELLFGLDSSIRNWKGYYYNKLNPYIGNSIPSTDTKNKAIFSQYEKSLGKLSIEVGARYDNTSVKVLDSTRSNNDYNALNGHVYSAYNLDKNTKIFAGIGKNERVPDARELYSTNSNGTITGNDNLKATQNYEIDLGIEKRFREFSIKSKVFYSRLKDYIYNKNGSSFENIDARIYGAEVSGYYLIGDNIILDYGASYLKGKKDNALDGQTDKDLAEISPLKANLSLSYDFGPSVLTAQLVASKSWSNYDEDNGEQNLSGYAIINTKYNHKINKNIELTLGIDNLFDKTYASTNTYNDIKYIGVGETELINDPGRYLYANFKYSF